MACLLAILIVYASCFLAVKTNANNILPQDISMRTTTFDQGFYSSVYNGEEDVVTLKPLLEDSFSGGRLKAIRQVVGYHADPLFLYSLLMGKETAHSVLMIAFYLRFGLAAGAMQMLLERISKNSRVTGLLFSLIYSLSGIALVSSLLPVLMNFLVVLPVAVMFTRDLVRNRDLKTAIYLYISLVVMIATGIAGSVSGIPLIILVAVFFALGEGKKTSEVFAALGRVLVSVFFAAGTGMVFIVCQIAGAGEILDLKESLEDTKPVFTVFDFLVNMTDGKVPDASAAGAAPAFGTGIIILLLLVLFFLNGKISFGHKALCGMTFLIILLSGSVPFVNDLFSLFDNGGMFLWSRYIILVMMMILTADLSFEMLPGIGKGKMYLAAALVLGLIILSNSSASEVSPSVFSLLYSFVAVIFWTIFLMGKAEDEGVIKEKLMIAGLMGFAINFAICLAPATFSGSFLFADKVSSDDNNGMFYLDLSEEVNVPLFADDGQGYILVRGDLSEKVDSKSFPELIDLMDDQAFIKVPAFTIFKEGAEEPVPGLYETTEQKGSVILMASSVELDQIYFVSTCLEGRQYITETYEENDRVTLLEGPSFVRIYPTSATMNVKTAFKQMSEGMKDFSIWKAGPGLDRLALRLVAMKDGLIKSDPVQEAVTVVTSYPYDKNYNILRNGKKAADITVFDLAGNLAFVESRGGNEVYEIREKKADLISGTVITILFAASVAGGYYMYNKKNIKRTDTDKRA